MRPKSIVLFERIFIVIILLGIASGIWVYAHMSEVMPASTTPQVAALASPIMVASMGFGVLINLLLLYFIARRASEVAKWIFIVFFALGLLSLVRGLTGGTVAMHGLMRILSPVQFLLQLVCVVLLFRPDAKAWFKGGPIAKDRDLHDTFS